MTDAARMTAEAAIEPAAVAFSTNDEERFALSAAISLKRIADALVGDDTIQGIAATLFYMEQRLGPQS